MGNMQREYQERSLAGAPGYSASGNNPDVPHTNTAAAEAEAANHAIAPSANQLYTRDVAIKRLCREILQDFREGYHFQGSALDALHEVSEAHLISIFEGAAIHARRDGRVTVQARDILRARDEQLERAAEHAEGAAEEPERA
ncbi:histone-fold-containing protein [Neofusicoccum parvum]|nr:histone-fold-containing protein [Neofusicoccum parvum]